MYGPELAELYERIYVGRGKDYAAESAEITEVIRARHPGASSLLDIACGTGGHLAFLSGIFDSAEGVELSEHMITRAAETIPGVPVHQGDMRDFALGRRFSALTCMFSSIGYLASPEDLNSALTSFARHVEPGGVVVLEPWYFPDAFIPGYIARDVVRTNGRATVRVSHSTRTGDRVPIVVHYVDADAQGGLRHFSDVHTMTLFTRGQYEAAFEQAGCTVEYLSSSRFGCGLFVGVRG